METYFNELLASEFRFELWVAARRWGAFLSASCWLAQSRRVANDAQQAVTGEDPIRELQTELVPWSHKN